MVLKKYKKEILYCIVFFGVSFLFVTLFSRTTSPLYPVHYGYDSPIFETIGKYWSKGEIPYKDLFDHKGPFVFMINMLGYCLSGTSSGIWMFQIVFLAVSIAAMYKILTLEITEKKKRIVFLLMTVCVLTLTYDEGNLTEEYVLPFLCISIYGQLTYIKNFNVNKNHNLKWGFFYGVTFAVCFLTRLTNAIGLMVGILPIIFCLIREKKIKNIAGNAISFIGGFLLLFIPFAIYFYTKGAFEDFMFGTIGFNLEYSKFTTPWWQKENPILFWKIFIIRFFSVYGMFLPAILAYKRKAHLKAYWIFLIAIMETLFFMNGNLYPHYATIAISNFLIILGEVSIFKPKNKINKKILKCLLILYLLGTLLYCVKDNMKAYKESTVYVPEYDALMKNIPQNERNSFVAYQTDRNIYLKYEIKPYYKYFILQEAQAQYSLKLKKDIYDTYLTGDAKWILVCTKGNVMIQSILDKKYKIFSESKDYELYRKIE